jgi:hypothetical protein
MSTTAVHTSRLRRKRSALAAGLSILALGGAGAAVVVATDGDTHKAPGAGSVAARGPQVSPSSVTGNFVYPVPERIQLGKFHKYLAP